MKYLSFLLCALSTIALADAPKIHMACLTQPYSTSIVAETKDKELHLRVVHHNGVGYAPALSGNYTPNDIPILTERAALARKLAMDMTFIWPIEKCKKIDDIRYECSDSKQVLDVNGVKIKPWSIEISRFTEEFSFGTFVSNKASILLNIDGKDLFLEMRYAVGECIPIAGDFRIDLNKVDPKNK